MGGLLGRRSHTDRALDRNTLVGRSVPINGVPYQFQQRLGKGGFGAVYKAISPKGVPVAVKTINLAGLPPQAKKGYSDSYLNEVQLLGQLRGETSHVVIIHDYAFDPRSGTGYIVMELGQETLSTLITRLRQLNQGAGPGIDSDMVKEFWRQMVSIISTLHRNKIIHMDLKPDNLILFGMTLKIADLGISVKENTPGRGGTGTMYFSAPEIMEDEPGVERYYGPKADVWSLGAILYFMVYGQPPTYHHLAANPPRGQLPHPDPLLIDMLRRTLVKNPKARADMRFLAAHPYTRL